MRRRDFILASGATSMAARSARAAAGDAGDRLSRRGGRRSRHLIAAFRRGLAEAGYVEGKNFAIEYRFTNSRVELA